MVFLSKSLKILRSPNPNYEKTQSNWETSYKMPYSKFEGIKNKESQRSCHSQEKPKETMMTKCNILSRIQIVFLCVNSYAPSHLLMSLWGLQNSFLWSSVLSIKIWCIIQNLKKKKKISTHLLERPTTYLNGLHFLQFSLSIFNKNFAFGKIANGFQGSLDVSLALCWNPLTHLQ